MNPSTVMAQLATVWLGEKLSPKAALCSSPRWVYIRWLTLCNSPAPFQDRIHQCLRMQKGQGRSIQKRILFTIYLTEDLGQRGESLLMGFCAQFLASPAPPASRLELWTSWTTHWSSHSHNTPRLQRAKSVFTSRIELCGNDRSMKSSCRKGFVNALGQYDRSHFFTEGFMTTTLLTSFAFPVWVSSPALWKKRKRADFHSTAEKTEAWAKHIGLMSWKEEGDLESKVRGLVSWPSAFLSLEILDLQIIIDGDLKKPSHVHGCHG